MQQHILLDCTAKDALLLVFSCTSFYIGLQYLNIMNEYNQSHAGDFTEHGRIFCKVACSRCDMTSEVLSVIARAETTMCSTCSIGPTVVSLSGLDRSLNKSVYST
jgi:hypothetical protein